MINNISNEENNVQRVFCNIVGRIVASNLMDTGNFWI